MLDRLQKLQANKGQFASGGELSKACKSNLELRSEIEALAKFYLSKQVSGCSNCYFDAYFELINLNLEKAMSKEICEYKLRAGALLHDVVNFDNDLLCSNSNITDELALYHLRTNPSCRKYFEKLPENVDALIAGIVINEAEKAIVEPVINEAEKAIVEEIKAMLKAGTSKTAIRKQYINTTVGTKKINNPLVSEFIKLAEA